MCGLTYLPFLCVGRRAGWLLSGSGWLASQDAKAGVDLAPNGPVFGAGKAGYAMLAFGPGASQPAAAAASVDRRAVRRPKDRA